MTDPFEFAIRPWQYQRPDEPAVWNPADHEHNYRELEDYLRNLVTDLQAAIFATQWVLYKDDSGALTVNGDEATVCLLNQWQHSTDYGDHVGWWNVRAVATGSGTVTFRLINLNGLAVEETWVEDFNAATFANVVFSGTWARQDLTDYVQMMLTAEVTSGSGTLAIASGDANLHALVLSLIGTPPLPAADSEVFSYTGAVQQFEVPPLVTSITVKAYGGAGQSGGGNPGGRGDYIVATVPVTPGETLDIYVGGAGSFNGAGTGDVTSGSGNGGGASDVRRYPYALLNRLVVAGGGGGGGAGFTSNTGGNGGYPSGTAGVGGNGGGGGTASAGGTGGSSTNPAATPDGSFGEGGDGGNGSGTRGGGGGGGGWYGGGGGGATFGALNAGGGGGSSYVDTASGVVLVSSSTGGGPSSNTATVTIEWGA